MKKRLILSLSLLLIGSVTLMAQKRAVTHDDYDSWKSIQSARISNNGQWTHYAINPQQGDGKLEVRQLNGNGFYTIHRASNFRFSATSNFLVSKVDPEYQKEHDLKLEKTSKTKMPKDSLFLLNLSNGDIRKEARVKSYKMASEESDWIAWLHEKPLASKKKDKSDTTKKKEKKPKSKSKGTELVLLNMATNVEHRWEGVMDYAISEKGNYLYIEKDEADSLNPSGVFAFNTKNAELSTLNTGLVDYIKLTPDKSGEQLAFMGSDSDKKTKDKYFSLMHWKAGDDEASIVADTVTGGMPESWMVSRNGTPRFSDSGKRLYFRYGTQDR